jgi:hypothetical protein
VAGGICDAQDEAYGSIEIVPKNILESKMASDAGVSALQTIDFDVLVTIQEKKGRDAKIGVFSNIIGAGLESQVGNEISHASRLKFRVPVRYRKLP